MGSAACSAAALPGAPRGTGRGTRRDGSHGSTGPSRGPVKRQVQLAVDGRNPAKHLTPWDVFQNPANGGINSWVCIKYTYKPIIN